MSSQCEDQIPALLRAADGSLNELPADQRARLQAHLTTCAACAEALAGQTSMRQALSALAGDPVPTFVGSRVMAELRSAAPAFSWLDALDFKRWTWRLVPIAAMLALAVGSVAATSDDTDAPTATATATTNTTATATMPASAALVTGEVGGIDLLSLLLNSTADATVPIASGGVQ